MLAPLHGDSSEAGTARPSSRAAGPRADVTIPFELVNKTIFIRVMVNATPLWFVFDTGDKYAVIDLATARRLRLELGDSVAVGGGGKDLVMGSFLKNSRFRVAGLEGFSQPLFIAVPLDALAKGSGHEFAGVLGFDFISQFVVEIDYPSRTITLHDKAAYRYGGHGDVLPITFNAAGHPQVAAQVIDDGRAPIDGTFVIDIGSGAALILNTPFVAREKLLDSGRPTVRWLEGQGFGGGIDGSVGRITGLKLGKALIDNPVTVFSRAASGPFASTDAQGNIGAAILEKFRIFLDYAHERIVLEPNASFPERLEYNRSGLSLVSFGPDYREFKIDAVADSSPASEAGAQAGDILIAIDGQPVTRYTLSQLRLMFKDAPRRVLSVQRSGARRELTLELRSLI